MDNFTLTDDSEADMQIEKKNIHFPNTHSKVFIMLHC